MVQGIQTRGGGLYIVMEDVMFLMGGLVIRTRHGGKQLTNVTSRDLFSLPLSNQGHTPGLGKKLCKHFFESQHHENKVLFPNRHPLATLARAGDRRPPFGVADQKILISPHVLVQSQHHHTAARQKRQQKPVHEHASCSHFRRETEKGKGTGK